VTSLRTTAWAIYGALYHLVSVDFSCGFLAVVLCNIKRFQIIIIFLFSSHLETIPRGKEQKGTFTLLFSYGFSTYSVGLTDNDCHSVGNFDRCLCPM